MLVKEIKEFNELSTRDLYKILRLRSEVFVVEQNCVYQDLDGKDYQAFHMLGYHDNDLVAYTRIFKPGDYFKEVSIGRVVVSSIQRGSGFGYEIMKFSIDFRN
jgi:ElaA protein